LSQGEGGVFYFEIFSQYADCQQDQGNNSRQDHTEPNRRKKKSAQDRFLGGDKIVPVKTGSYDDVCKDYGQKMPEQIITLKTPDDILRQLVYKSRHSIKRFP
jgi:hypothetical protein